MDTKAIRTKVLDLAVRGMLTRRRPDDGAAEDLLTQIQTEKQALIAAGRIKREKPLLEITEEEKPFEVPEQWKWVRLGDYVEKVTDQVASGSFAALRENVVSKKTPDYAIMVKTADFSNGFTKNLTYTDKHGYEFLENSNLYGGELILSNVGSIGKCFIVPELEYKMTLAPNAVMIRLTSNELRDFLYYFILSSYGQSELQSITTGVAMQKFNKTELKTILIPVPPLPEQLRIVANVDQIFTILDTINTLQSQYQDNLAALKSKIIDAGIQGKLTKQLSEDGTAEELYQQIQQERKKQEECGKIKKEDLFPDIEDQSIPFSVPNTWLWTYLGNVSYIVRGGSPRPIKQYITHDADGINWIKIGDVEKGGKYIYHTNERIIPEGEKKSRRVYPGDFLLTNSMSFGRPYISQIEGCIHDGWLLIRNLNGFDPDYLYYLLSSSYLYGQFTEKASGSTVDNLNIDKVKSAMIPLPPLAEQKRIVAKLEELLPLCEGK